MSKVRNTTKQIHENPIIGLPMLMNNKYIEQQEANGQAELVQSDVLPTEIGAEDKAVLEKAGVIFGEVVKGDDIFTNVTLPFGWKKKRTDHSMWSELLDGKGRVRASIFIKPHFMIDALLFVQIGG